MFDKNKVFVFVLIFDNNITRMIRRRIIYANNFVLFFRYVLIENTIQTLGDIWLHIEEWDYY